MKVKNLKKLKNKKEKRERLKVFYSEKDSWPKNYQAKTKLFLRE
jgi:hypothetical protein